RRFVERMNGGSGWATPYLAEGFTGLPRSLRCSPFPRQRIEQSHTIACRTGWRQRLRTVGPHRAGHVDMRPGHVLGDERLDEVRTRARAWRGAVAGVLHVGDRGFDRLRIARVERQAPDGLPHAGGHRIDAIG